MDANTLEAEWKVRESFYPSETHKSTLEDEIKGADELYYKFINEQEQKASTAANAQQQQQQGDTKPEGLRGVIFKRDER
jgi:hypothetical protein